MHELGGGKRHRTGKGRRSEFYLEMWYAKTQAARIRITGVGRKGGQKDKNISVG